MTSTTQESIGSTLVSQEKIYIVTACDDQYIQPLCVMLCSLLENTSYSSDIDINIIDGGISDENINQLNNFIENNYNLKINYLTIDESLYQNFPLNYHLAPVTYYRISIPSLFNESIKKILYLDTDMVILDDVKKIWDYDISEYYAASVEVVGFDQENRYDELYMPQKSLYFCAGILLINLDIWKANKIAEKTIQFIHDNSERLSMMDQDALNSILCGKWLPLPLNWNQLTSFFDTQIYNRFRERNDFLQAVNNPAIVHYTGSYKPWHYGNNHPYRHEYFKYLRLTPWRDVKPEFTFISLKRMFKQSFLNFSKKKVIF